MAAGSRSPNNVVEWYRLYCGLLLLLFVGVAPAALLVGTAQQPPFASAAHPTLAELQFEHDARVAEVRVLGLLVCALFAAPVAVALFLRPTPGAWLYHAFIICLGMSGCTLPLAVILLIYWLRPETQAHFGRGMGQPT